MFKSTALPVFQRKSLSQPVWQTYITLWYPIEHFFKDQRGYSVNRIWWNFKWAEFQFIFHLKSSILYKNKEITKRIHEFVSTQNILKHWKHLFVSSFLHYQIKRSAYWKCQVKYLLNIYCNFKVIGGTMRCPKKLVKDVFFTW